MTDTTQLFLFREYFQDIISGNNNVSWAPVIDESPLWEKLRKNHLKLLHGQLPKNSFFEDNGATVFVTNGVWVAQFKTPEDLTYFVLKWS